MAWVGASVNQMSQGSYSSFVLATASSCGNAMSVGIAVANDLHYCSYAVTEKC